MKNQEINLNEIHWCKKILEIKTVAMQLTKLN